VIHVIAKESDLERISLAFAAPGGER
jgi:hypothetical protein